MYFLIYHFKQDIGLYTWEMVLDSIFSCPILASLICFLSITYKKNSWRFISYMSYHIIMSYRHKPIETACWSGIYNKSNIANSWQISFNFIVRNKKKKSRFQKKLYSITNCVDTWNQSHCLSSLKYVFEYIFLYNYKWCARMIKVEF